MRFVISVRCWGVSSPPENLGLGDCGNPQLMIRIGIQSYRMIHNFSPLISYANYNNCPGNEVAFNFM